jgi:tryptophan synthase beta chain
MNTESPSLLGEDAVIDPARAIKMLTTGELPDARGRFGPFGGRFVPETLMPALTRLEAGARAAFADPAFHAELAEIGRDWIGRPTPLCYAANLSKSWGAEIWLKREDLAHTGAHKINNAMGQALLAKRIGATRIIAETGAGQHGVATAAACARLGLPAVVYIGAHDVERQAPNVQRMTRLGAEVRPVESGDRTLRAAIDEALRDWVSDPTSTYYLLGSAVGPHPFPWIVRELQSVVGREARAAFKERLGRLPDHVVACVGGGSNAIGMFHPFLADTSVNIVGIEAGGQGPGRSSATMGEGRPGVMHGCLSMLMQSDDGQVADTQSVSAGLDYPGVGPEHAFLRHIGRVTYTAANDDAALDALDELCRTEGILPAVEPSHALAGAKQLAAKHPGSLILINLCGRGDKDQPILAKHPPRSAGGTRPGGNA